MEYDGILGELIDKIDIVDYISQFVDLRERNGEFWGLSPFSDEKTPSFSVRRDKKTFYCFSSGIGGNVYTFTRNYYKCDAKKALEILKQYAGIDSSNTMANRRMAATRVCKQYRPIVSQKKQSKAEVLPENCMEKYERRADKLKVWENEGISPEVLDKFQVRYDGFSDRLVYPIRDTNGNIVNIGGRTMDPDWKEKKLKKYMYFYSWGEMNTIYGLYENRNEIKEKKEIILFEGCKSVLIASTWGIGNTGAILTSHMSPNQMKILIKLGCDVVFCLDKEIDIRKDRNIQKLKSYVNVYYYVDYNNSLQLKDSPVDRGKGVFLWLYNHLQRF